MHIKKYIKLILVIFYDKLDMDLGIWWNIEKLQTLAFMYTKFMFPCIDRMIGK